MWKKVLFVGLILFVGSVLTSVGCKVKITVPNGGKVVSKSGAYVCKSGQVCTIEINDLFFFEEFVGQPDTGNKFVKWRKRKRGLCGNKVGPCKVDSSLAELHENFMKILRSDDVFHLEPVFAIPGIDISLRKAVDNSLPKQSEVINFVVEVTNIGQETAPNVEVIDLMPEGLIIPEGFAAHTTTGDYNKETGLWLVGEMLSGVTETLSIPAQVRENAHSICFTNKAEVLGSDSRNYNNFWSVVIGQFGEKRCADLSIGPEPVIGEDRPCGGKQALTYSFYLFNRGPEEARNVFLKLTENSPYKLPGLRLVSGDNCAGLECHWETLPHSIRGVAAVTDKFNNKQPREHSFTLSVTTSDEDYQEKNNTYTRTGTIPRFDVKCPESPFPGWFQ